MKRCESPSVPAQTNLPRAILRGFYMQGQNAEGSEDLEEGAARGGKGAWSLQDCVEQFPN